VAALWGAGRLAAATAQRHVRRTVQQLEHPLAGAYRLKGCWRVECLLDRVMMLGI
jgi:hypothetical protein